MQYILNAAFDVRYFMDIYLTSFFIINLEVANFVIFEILSICRSTVFIGVNNIFCFFFFTNDLIYLLTTPFHFFKK